MKNNVNFNVLERQKSLQKHGNALNNNWVIIHIEMSVHAAVDAMLKCWENTL